MNNRIIGKHMSISLEAWQLNSVPVNWTFEKNFVQWHLKFLTQLNTNKHVVFISSYL